jgi:hypothetical protein
MGIPVDSTLDFEELAATPGAPAAGITRLYSKTSGGLFVQSSAVAEKQLLVAGDAAAVPTYSNSLPASPTNGQETYFETPEPGALWHLRYNAGSGNWEYLGGNDYFSNTVTAFTLSAQAQAFTNVPNSSLSAPLPGNYICTVSTSCYPESAACTEILGFSFGGGGASTTDRCAGGYSPAAGCRVLLQLEEYVGLSAGETFNAQLWQSVSTQTFTFSQLWVSMRPVVVT